MPRLRVVDYDDAWVYDMRPTGGGHPMMTLKEAQDWLRDRIDVGAECPCCHRFAKVYRRKLNSNMAAGLIRMWRKSGRDWCYLPDVQGYGDEVTRLQHWGLIESMPDRADDGNRSGMWRITSRGESFLHGELTVLSHARIYAGRCLGVSGRPITIRHALGSHFDYNELMGL